MPDKSLDAEEIGARLRWLRIAISAPSANRKPIKGLTGWAAYVGIGISAWHNYEKGIRRIALEEAVKVAGKTGATLDWIYRGDAFWHQLPDPLKDKLTAAQSDRDNNGTKRAS